MGRNKCGKVKTSCLAFAVVYIRHPAREREEVIHSRHRRDHAHLSEDGRNRLHVTRFRSRISASMAGALREAPAGPAWPAVVRSGFTLFRRRMATAHLCSSAPARAQKSTCPAFAPCSLCPAAPGRDPTDHFVTRPQLPAGACTIRYDHITQLTVVRCLILRRPILCTISSPNLPPQSSCVMCRVSRPTSFTTPIFTLYPRRMGSFLTPNSLS